MTSTVNARTGRRNPLLIWMATGVVAYALVSGCVAVATLDRCGHIAAKQWIIIPPHWDCSA